MPVKLLMEILTVIALGVICNQPAGADQDPATTVRQSSITIEDLYDKVRGGWVGQMVGVSFGFPTEFAYPDEPQAKSNESIWHALGLENERHELRIVVLGESFGASTGADISITSLLVFE